MHALKSARSFAGIGPERTFIDRPTWFLIACIFLHLSRAISHPLTGSLRALQAVRVLICAGEGVPEIHAHIPHAIGVRNRYWKILVDFAIRLYFCQGDFTILVGGE